MAGIYPGGGVPAAQTNNGVEVDTTNCEGSELFYSIARCQPRFEPAAMNALISEVLNLATCDGEPYDCSRLDNLCRAVSNMVGIHEAEDGRLVKPGQLVFCDVSKDVYWNDTGADIVLSDPVDCTSLESQGLTPLIPTGPDVGVPAGAIMHFAMNTPPSGWIKADGSIVSRATYANLFTAIGTTYGAGDGATTFQLPDLRAMFVRGWDDGRGVDSGRVFGSNQADELASHSHVIPSSDGGQGGAALNLTYGAAGGTPYSTNNTGGSETRPVNTALLACIKT